LLELWLNTLFAAPVTPFLPAFAAVIASAAWAGFGPGILSTALVTAWCAAILAGEHQHTLVGEIVRCGLFAAEGLLLSVGSGRLRRANLEVARSEDWHRRLLDTTGEGIWVTDSEGVITYTNPRIAEILGTAAGEILGHKADEFFFPADLSIERIRFENRRAGLKEQFDRRLRRTDGREAWVLACSNPISDRSGVFLGVLATMTDITERKRAEQALRRSEERFRGLFENVLEGVYQSTPDGRIIAANPMLLRMLGLASEAQLNDVNIARDLYVDSNVRKRLLERLERDGSFQNVEYQLRRFGGTRKVTGHIITVQENARVVRDEEGKVLYYEGTLTDISERKRIEELLRQAQKMEALGRLAGGIAHDFGNVLTIISGYAHLAVSELSPTHPARASAEHVVRAADSASDLTRQLLTFSRLQTVTPTPVDLNRVIGRAGEALRRALDERAGEPRSELVLSTGREPAPVYADEGHVEQIVLNLAISASRALRPGALLEVKIEVVDVEASFCRHYPGSRPGPYAAISVREAGTDDTSESGAAIPDASTEAGREAAAGFGVGTTHAIVSQYGGFMVVDRVPNGGAVFSVYLPRVAEAETVRAADLLEAARGPAQRETILLVEDEPLTRELSRDMLERQGYRVLLAADAREAERIGRQGTRFDLLIADLIMPQSSGPELARNLRSSIPDLKALFISRQDDSLTGPPETDPEYAFLQKPFSVDSLGRKIRQILDRA
jgi:two-component system cell cycle sensor histidine kinase/response regulator CckA